MLNVSNQLRARGRTRLHHTLGQEGMPSNVYQPVSEEGASGEGGIGGRNAPDGAIVAPCLESFSPISEVRSVK